MMMSMTTTLDQLDVPQHVALSGVTWAYYEHTLEQIGDRPIRVSFLDGEMEIMSPLPEHETIKKAIAQLVETLTSELDLPRKSFGSTTFRREEKSAGTEADECYDFHNIERVSGMKRFDAGIHPAPDLAIEVDQSMVGKDETQVLRTFRQWVRMLDMGTGSDPPR